MTGQRRSFPSVLLIASLADSELADRLRRGLREAQLPAWVLYADDEDALNSGEASLDYTALYDRLALLCTDSALENPLTSRYFAELVRAGSQPSAAPLAALAFGELFYQRQDRLCKRLRSGDAFDFRNGDDAALESFISELSAPVF